MWADVMSQLLTLNQEKTVLRCILFLFFILFWLFAICWSDVVAWPQCGLTVPAVRVDYTCEVVVFHPVK